MNICNNEFMGVNLFLYCSDHKGVMSLGRFTRDSADTVNVRGSDLPVGSANWPELQGNDLLSPQRASSFTASFESPNHTGT